MYRDIPRKEILVVDDDQKNIFALKAILASRGYKVTSAMDSMECIEILHDNNKIGVVLLDMMMPVTDGYETIKMIRDMEGREKLPVIAVTAQAMAGDRQKCLEAGADDYLSKPIDVDLLFQLLPKYLNDSNE